MTSTDNIAYTSPSDTGLNLLWPGLAQFGQKRFGPAVLFALDAACACGWFVWSPPTRVLAAVVLLALTTWSIVDASAYERKARSAA